MNPLGLTFRDTAQRPCQDCPAWYARDMRSEGRCNGYYGGELPVTGRARNALGHYV